MGKILFKYPGREAFRLQVAKAGISRCRSIAFNSEKKAKLTVMARLHCQQVIAVRKSLWDRLRHFQRQRLTLENGKIFCQACSEPLAGKKSTISAHVKSPKHLRGKALFGESKVRSQTLAEALERYDKQSHPIRGHLPSDVRVWRMKSLKDFFQEYL